VAVALPASLRAAGRQPGTGIADIRVSHGANVRVSHDHYGVHIEPHVAVNPRRPRQLMAACQVSPTAAPEFLASYLSFDGGATWQSGGVPVLPAGHTTTGDDVTVAFDQQGRGYMCATSYSGGRAVYVWRTDDGGRTFSAPVTLVENQYNDHPRIAIGTGRTLSERNTVYVAWAAIGGDIRNPRNKLLMTRSTDGGESFEAPRTILPEATAPSDISAGPDLAAGPHGLVCATCFWTTLQPFGPPPPKGGVPRPSGDAVGHAVVVSSTDGGRSFSEPVHLGSGSLSILLPGDVNPNGGPTVAISPRGDAFYVAFTKHRKGAIHSDIVVFASHDRGRTWSKPVTATPADDVIYFQPNLAVDHAGRVAISAFALAHGRVDQVLLLSHPRQLRFRPPLRVTTAPFNPHNPTDPFGRKHGAWWIGDYQGIAAGAGAFHLVWNDTRTGKLDLFAATVRP
jgi:hypothetical protein